MVTELPMKSFELADTKPCLGVCPLKPVKVMWGTVQLIRPDIISSKMKIR